jgi:hypothetical protein
MTQIDNPAHRLTRFARRSQTDTRPDGSVVVTLSAFFWSKAGPDDLGLSVNWLDYFPGDLDAQLNAVRAAMHMSPNASDRLAILQVGQVRDSLRAEAGLSITVIHDPAVPNPPRYPFPDPSHAVIAGLPNATLDGPTAQTIAAIIARDCVIEHVPARRRRNPATP